MRKILICTLLAAAFSAQAQIRTVGITYTAGAPTFTPSTQGSFIAYDTTGREFYEFFGGVWSKAGQSIDQIAGAVAPAYTPTKMDARFAINASGQLYWWNGSAWVQVGGLSEPVASLLFSSNNNAVATGRLQYSDDVGDFVFGGIGGTQLEVTQKHVYYVRNAEATTLAAGEVVYAFGTLGASGRITVKRYIANGTIPSKYVIGIVAAPIAAGADGYAVDFGKIRGLNTDTLNAGDVLYASASNAGQLTNVAPIAPNFRLPIAFVVHSSATAGVIAVRINGGYALEDLHNVAATAPTNGQVLTYNTSTSTWGPAAPADGSATNEGVLGVGAGTGTTSIITSNTSGATGVTITAGSGLSISETTSANGGTITLTNSAPDQTVSLTGTGITVGGTYPSFTLTAADQSNTNELQTLSHASDATSHTVTLSNTGGSLKLIEGSNITLTTNNTNEVTIASTGGGGATDLTFTGSASPFTLNSSTGTDVTFAQGGIVSLSRSNNELTISATIDDASLTYAKIQNSDSLSVLGRAGGTNGVLDEIIAASDHQVLRRSGTSIGFGAVNLAQSNAVTGTLAASNGGTGNAFFAVSGPASSVKTFTFPNASATVLTTNAAVTVGQGGTGRTTQTAYMPIIGGTTTTGAQQSVATGSTAGQALLYQGTSTNPSFGAINLAGGSNIVTGTLPVLQGGTGQTSYTNGQLLIGNTTGNTLTKATLTAGHHTTVTNGAGSIAIGTAQDTLCMIIACSDETTNLTTGTKVTFRAPFRMNIVSVRANVNTVPTGTNIIVDINEGGTTIMTTNKIVIETNETTSLDATTQPGVTDADIAADAECTIDIDQVGSTAAGKGLKVHIYYTKLY